MIMKKIYLDSIDIFEIHRFFKTTKESKEEIMFIPTSTDTQEIIDFKIEKDLVAVVVYYDNKEQVFYRNNSLNIKDVEAIKEMMIMGEEKYINKMKLCKLLDVKKFLDEVIEIYNYKITYSQAFQRIREKIGFSEQDINNYFNAIGATKLRLDGIQRCCFTEEWTLDNLKYIYEK